MRPIVCVYVTDAGPDLIWADVSHLNLVISIHGRNISGMHRASNPKLTLSGTITVQLRKDE